MQKLTLVFILILQTSLGFSAFTQSVNILVITGGREIPRAEFLPMFDAMEGISWEEAVQPKANEMIEQGKGDQYDVLVFYDMYEEITPSQKKAYVDLFKKGKPALFLHHSLVSYQHWDEFEEIIGARYYDSTRLKGLRPEGGFSTYRHDVEIPVEVIRTDHPVVRGVETTFTLFDEAYSNFYVYEELVIPILKTTHPDSDEIIAWENRYENSSIIYLQPGHGLSIFNDKNYQKLIHNALIYLKGTSLEFSEE